MFPDSAYCVVRRGTVRIAWTALPIHDGQAMLPDSPVPVCLDFGEACAIRRCPTFQVPRAIMAGWVARAGLGAGRLPSRRDRCGGCGEVVELQQVDAGSYFCPRCGGVGAAPAAPAATEGGAGP